MSSKQTALGRAMESKGFVRRNVELQIAISKFHNAGGEHGVALAMLNAAYGKGVGRGPSDSDVHPRDAGASGRDAVHSSHADKADLAATAPRPSHAKRGKASIDAVQPTVAKSLFDSIVLPDGRPLREVRWSECPQLASRYQRLARILLACRNFAVPPDPSAPLADVVPEAELHHIVEAAERLNAVN